MKATEFYDASNAPFITQTLPNGDLSVIGVQYTQVEANGVLILVITSVFSIIAVTGLLLAIALSAWNTRKSTSPNLFVRTNIAPYFVLMLIADFLQAIGSLMNGRWVQLDGVYVGGYCTAQGVIKHISDIGVAMWSLVIAFHTFFLLFYRLRIPRWVMYITLVAVQGLVILVTPLGSVIYNDSGRGSFYGIAGYWCWITAEFETARIVLDYMIMFISAIGSMILYSLVFFRMRGNIVVNGWYIRFRRAEDNWRGRDFAPGDSALTIAKQMLLYPIAYTITILPISAARFCEWAGHNVPFNITIFCDVVFLLSGLVNVVLFVTTRRLLPSETVFPGWRKLLPILEGFQRPSQTKGTADRSFASHSVHHQGDLEKNFSISLQKIDEELLSAHSDSCPLPSSRIKIDNHVDNTLTTRDRSDIISISSIVSSNTDMPLRPPPVVTISHLPHPSEHRKALSTASSITLVEDDKTSMR